MGNSLLQIFFARSVRYFYKKQKDFQGFQDEAIEYHQTCTKPVAKLSGVPKWGDRGVRTPNFLKYGSRDLFKSDVKLFSIVYSMLMAIRIVNFIAIYRSKHKSNDGGKFCKKGRVLAFANV